MRYKVLLLLGLLVGCTPIDKIETDYNKGWIVEQDGTRHFYPGEIILGEPMHCLMHDKKEVVYLKKNLKQAPENK